MRLDRFRVEPGAPVDLTSWDTNDDDGLDKAEAKAQTEELNARLETLQETLYAEAKHPVLVVIQATDTGGKDGQKRKGMQI